MRSIFMGLEKGGGFLADSLTFLLLFILNPGYTFREVRACKVDKHRSAEPPARQWEFNVFGSQPADLNFALEQARASAHTEETRMRAIGQKNKVLLTVASVLLVVDAAVFDRTSLRWLAVLTLSCMLTAVYLVLVHFRVQQRALPDYDRIAGIQSTSAAKAMAIRDWFGVARWLSPRNDYQVAVYAAAHRATVMGALLLVPLLFCATLGWCWQAPSPNSVRPSASDGEDMPNREQPPGVAPVLLRQRTEEDSGQATSNDRREADMTGGALANPNDINVPSSETATIAPSGAPEGPDAVAGEWGDLFMGGRCAPDISGLGEGRP